MHYFFLTSGKAVLKNLKNQTIAIDQDAANVPGVF